MLFAAKFSWPMTRIFPSVENSSVTWPLKSASEVYSSKMSAEPVIVIGEVNAAAQPFWPDDAACACATTCCLMVESQLSTLTPLVGVAKAAPRSCIGSVIEGSVWKNWTPPAKLLIAMPVSGSSRIPVGVLTLMKTPSGPSWESANRIVKPDSPAKLKPPSTPAKKMRCATGVVVLPSGIRLPEASSLRMPPSSAASSVPPKRLPWTPTPIESMPDDRELARRAACRRRSGSPGSHR